MHSLDVSGIDMARFMPVEAIGLAFSSLKPSADPLYKFTKICMPALELPIKMMYDKFVKLGALPDVFNSAVVTPLHKGKGSTSDPGYYRPISNLPIFSKLYEKLVFRQLTQFVDQENLLDPQLHGFCRHRSCTTALPLFSHDVHSNLNAPNMKAGVVFVDLKKAFDSICPLKLLHLLAGMKIPPIILRYLYMYFTKRTFRIKLPNFLSKLFCIGVFLMGAYYHHYYFRSFIMMSVRRF